MDDIKKIIDLLFGEDDELRQIIFTTLKMAFFTTIFSSVFGILLVLLVGKQKNWYSLFLRSLITTFMGIPPVVGGLIVYLIFSRSGPLGEFKLLFSVKVMVIAQVLLITPIIAGLLIPIFNDYYYRINETALGIGLSRPKKVIVMLYECRKMLISVVLSGFGRSIAEVGAVQLVGGNIQRKTRVMTTAIMLETNRGNFSFAIALGIVLLLISFFINWIASLLQKDK